MSSATAITAHVAGDRPRLLPLLCTASARNQRELLAEAFLPCGDDAVTAFADAERGSGTGFPVPLGAVLKAQGFSADHGPRALDSSLVSMGGIAGTELGTDVFEMFEDLRALADAGHRVEDITLFVSNE